MANEKDNRELIWRNPCIRIHCATQTVDVLDDTIWNKLYDIEDIASNVAMGISSDFHYDSLTKETLAELEKLQKLISEFNSSTVVIDDTIDYVVGVDKFE